jgi:hypothetical protein
MTANFESALQGRVDAMILHAVRQMRRSLPGD